MYKVLCIAFLVTLAQGYPWSHPQWPGVGNGQKIKWDDHKIYFPGPVNYKDTDKFYNNNPRKPVPSNDIRNEEPACVLTADLPDPDSQCCGVEATSHNRIVGGDATQLEQYPWLVHVQYYNKSQDRYKQLCGGFLISGRYVLSAAHCFDGEILQLGTPVNIVLGDYNTKNTGQDCVKTQTGTTACTDGEITVPIESHTVHPKHYHDRTINVNDIALVRLSKTVEYSKFVRPICMPTTDVSATAPPNLRVYAAGWGTIKQWVAFEQGRKVFTGISDGVKRHVDLPLAGVDKCRETFGSFINKGHLCAGGERGKDACKGDSGGPLMYENEGIFEAVGIVSTGSGKSFCGTENVPAIYTNVVQYLGWIKSTIKP